MFRELATEGKSRHEIITRAKISWEETGARLTQRAWIDRELREIGLSPLSDAEVKNYGIVTAPRLL
ncbi:MAG: hypothetical protein L6Q92_09125 [Phycisphaerae bacterium]|nr:hypothetical protein [Phycisphaerae bacterium]